MPDDQNHLIYMLPHPERVRLLSICKPVDLVLGDVLCRQGEPLRHVHSPVVSFISLVTNTDDHSGLEVGMIGREGMLGAHLALGVVRAPLQALVQCAGSAWRADVTAFRRVGVTAAAGALQDDGLISYTRGDMTVLDRSGLEKAACSCYATDVGVYDQQLG